MTWIRGDVHDAGDGWTVCTADGSTAAHAEHTIVITAGAPLVLTV
jgi:methionyl aminopeptidase